MCVCVCVYYVLKSLSQVNSETNETTQKYYILTFKHLISFINFHFGKHWCVTAQSAGTVEYTDCIFAES